MIDSSASPQNGEFHREVQEDIGPDFSRVQGKLRERLTTSYGTHDAVPVEDLDLLLPSTFSDKEARGTVVAVNPTGEMTVFELGLTRSLDRHGVRGRRYEISDSGEVMDADEIRISPKSSLKSKGSRWHFMVMSRRSLLGYGKDRPRTREYYGTEEEVAAKQAEDKARENEGWLAVDRARAAIKAFERKSTTDNLAGSALRIAKVGK